VYVYILTIAYCVVLAADFLQSLVNKAKDIDLLNVPIPFQYTLDFSIVQYVASLFWKDVQAGPCFS